MTVHPALLGTRHGQRAIILLLHLRREAMAKLLVQLVHAESDPGGGHELQQDHVIALLVGVFAQGGLGAQVVVVGQQHGAVADGVFCW